MYSGSQNRMRMRIFNVLDDVKRDHGFAPIVTRPAGERLHAKNASYLGSGLSKMCLALSTNP